MSKSKKPILPPTYFLVALVVEGGLHFLLPVAQLVRSPWKYAGVIPILLGVAVSIHGSKLFERRGTTIKPFEEPSVLVVDGAFRYSRNPMYLAMLAILAGSAIVFGSLTPWVVVVAFVPTITNTFILPEEASLEQAFGEQYGQYRRRVRRWF